MRYLGVSHTRNDSGSQLDIVRLDVRGSDFTVESSDSVLNAGSDLAVFLRLHELDQKGSLNAFCVDSYSEALLTALGGFPFLSHYVVFDCKPSGWHDSLTPLWLSDYPERFSSPACPPAVCAAIFHTLESSLS